MVNPSAVSDSAGEWVELRNASSHPILMDGVVFSDDNNDYFAVPNGIVLAPGAYWVAARNANSAVNGGVTANIQYSGITLTNTGDQFAVWLGTSLIDEVRYDLTWPLGAGVSLNLDPCATGAMNDDASAWCFATTPYGAGDWGTPGAPNVSCSVCGDGVCELGEACGDCAADCGACPPVCTDACTEGATQCAATLVQPCVMGPEGCTVWDEPEPCGAGLTCQGATCGPLCMDECTPGSTVCEGPLLRPCVTGPQGCTVYDEAEPCPSGTQCIGNQCAVPCSNVCTPGARRCYGPDTQECVSDAQGCGVWATPVGCPSPQSCTAQGQCGLVISTNTTLCGEHVVDGPFTVQGGATVTCGTGNLSVQATSIFVDPASSIHVDATSSITSGANSRKCSGCCNSNGIAAGAGGGGNATKGTNGPTSQYEVKACGEYCGGWWGWSCVSCTGGQGGPIRGSDYNLDVTEGGQGGHGCKNHYIACSGANRVEGGRGGGVVRLHATDSIVVYGTVSARGGDGDPQAPDADAGAGGGAGGGILLVAPTVNVTGTLDLSGGQGSPASDYDYGCSYSDTTGGPGAPGRLKIASAAPPSLTGTILGATAKTGWLPPTQFSSPTHPDLGAYYHDTFDVLTLQWQPAFPGAQGYWMKLTKSAAFQLTAATGTFTTATSTTFDADDFPTPGTWYLHVASVGPDGAVSGLASSQPIGIVHAPPVATSTSHPNSAVWYSGEAPHALAFSFDDPNAMYEGFWYRLDRSSVAPAGKGESGYTFSVNSQVTLTVDADGEPIGDGAWYLHLTAEDVLGNITEQASSTLVRLGDEPAKQNLYGYVQTAGGTPLPNVTVRLEPFGVTQTTDGNGYFLFSNQYAMDYVLTAELDGWYTFTSALTLDAGASPMMIQLEPVL